MNEFFSLQLSKYHSQNVELITALSEPPTFLNNEKEENDFEVIEGHSVVLPCEVSGFPVPVVTWLKDGSEVGIGGDSGFQILPEGSLEVSNAREEHEGGYVCQALNEAGSRRKQVSLSVFSELAAVNAFKIGIS